MSAVTEIRTLALAITTYEDKILMHVLISINLVRYYLQYGVADTSLAC